MSPAGPAVLALDIGATKLAAGVGGPGGEMHRLASASTRAAEGAESVLRRALALARDVFDAARDAGQDIDALGVSTMGYTHADRVELATNVPGWIELKIPAAVERAFPGLPVAFVNDVHGAARAELAWGALQGVGDAIYLNLGSGIAAGIVSGGRLITGANGAAGEVGYSLFRGVEPRMAADGIGPFEAWYGGTGAARRLAAEGLPPSVEDALALVDSDAGARRFIDELWTGIAVLTVNLCTALNPAVVAVGGGYVRGDSGVLERIEALVAQAVPYPPRVMRARFGADASLRGAVVCGVERAGVRA